MKKLIITLMLIVLPLVSIPVKTPEQRKDEIVIEIADLVFSQEDERYIIHILTSLLREYQALTN